MEEKIDILLKNSILYINLIYELLKEKEMLDTQKCLNWLDELNEISVR